MFFDLDNEEEDNIAKSVIQPHTQCFPYPKQAGQIELESGTILKTENTHTDKGSL